MSRFTPLILAIALFMQMMDSTVIATSLPAIARSIGAEPIALKLAMTSYLVSLAIFIPISGWMGDRFGARTVFAWSILVFMIGSLACASSNSLIAFVLARFLQGMGGAMMTPLARLMLVRVTPRSDLVSAMSWLTVPALLGPLVGPPVGGALTTFLSWHWIFFINIPIGVIGIGAVVVFLPEVAAARPRPIDWRGFALAGISFSGIIFGLSVVSLPALPPVYGIVSTVLGFVAGLVYLRHARRVADPLLNPELFRHPMFRAATIGGLVFRIALGAMPFLLPLMLQLGFGLTPFQSGLITLYGALGAIVAKFAAKAIYQTFGFKPVALAMTFASAALMAVVGLFDAATPVWMMAAVLIAAGLVRSTFFTGINAMSFADVSNEESGQATAMFTVFTQLSLAVGVALAGATLEFLSSGHGGAPTQGDFRMGFFVVAAVALFAFLPFLGLSRDAGSDVSGHFTEKDIEEAPVAAGK